MFLRLFILCITFIAAGLIQSVKAQSFIAEDGYAEFVSRAPLLEFKGTSDKLTGLINLDENLVDFYLDLNTLDTGIELRNRHMRESYLETAKYPFAEFTGKLDDSFDIDINEAQQVSVTGKFKLHGVEREIKVDGTLQKVDSGLHLKAAWEILLDDFKIDRPRVIFYELSEVQRVSIDIVLKEQ